MDLGPSPPLDNLFQAVKCPAADKKDIGCIHLYKILLGMFSSAFGRNTGGGAFNNF